MTASPRYRDDAEPSPGRNRLLSWLEAIGVFVLGLVVMHLLYAGTVSGPEAEIGVPGHDSFYHIAMASILPEVGAMSEFPWLEFTFFRDEGDAFVSHHWGFHLILLPFVKTAEWLQGDALAGGRWATSAMFGANLLLFHLLLRQRRVPLHWLWIGLFFLLPDQFFARQGFVRAIGPSLFFMQLILLGLFSRRIWLAGLAVAGYVHLYLGAVMFGPLLVATYAFALVAARPEDREIPVKLVLITAGAWVLGVLTYPYAGGIFEFLRLQVFGSGLSPDIEVGREWKPYTDAWFVVSMAAPLFVVWAGALLVRLRIGPRLNAEETTLLILNLAFLVLTFKARRFIEYWSPMCLLSAAYLASAPVAEAMGAVRRWVRASDAGRPSDARRRSIALAAHLLLVAAGALAWSRVAGLGEAGHFLRHWYLWTAPIALLAVAAVVRVWATQSGSLVPGRPTSPTWVRATVVILVALVLPAATLAVGGRSLASASRQLECYYDLDEIRSMMTFLQADSDPGDVVFTDDWDVFPLFFYFNRHNHYIVGLDPMFTYEREPDLWNRYVKISRGQVPSTIRLVGATDDDARATVAVEDIREHFGARYVIADHDHRALANVLLDDPHLAQLVYPSPDPDVVRSAPYVVFRILRPTEEGTTPTPEGDRTSPLFLSDLRPASVSQGWGDLASDRTVDGNGIRLGGRGFTRGVGTHAPSRIRYEIPAGYEWFEAVVGVDDETDGQGSIVVSVVLDGRTVYQSPRLTGGQPPATVRVPLEGASQIQIEASPTPDGQRYDHVSWAEARLVPFGAASGGRPVDAREDGGTTPAGGGE